MESKQFAPGLDDDGLSITGRDAMAFPSFRPQSPVRLTRRSIQSSRSSFSASSSFCSVAPDPVVPMSCVARDTLNVDCGTHRFVVWAAVRRNASTRMKANERLECPLLRCTLRFPDHESMLRHLVVCEYLPSCEYWCYDHMRIERFDDSRSKKCLGHASKPRKMLSRAKHFFTSIGHPKGKSVAGDPMVRPLSFSSTSLRPCSSVDPHMGYDGASRKGCVGHSVGHSHGNVDGRRCSNSSRRSGDLPDCNRCLSFISPFPFLGPPPPDCEAINRNNHVELPAREIPVEIDSVEVMAIPQQAIFEPLPTEPEFAPFYAPVTTPEPLAPLAGVVPLPETGALLGSVNPQDLVLPELASIDGASHDIAYSGLEISVSQPLTQLGLQSSNANSMSCGTQMPVQRSVRPSIHPTPRSKNLSPSSSVRSTASTASNTSATSDMSDMSTASFASTATSVSAVSVIDDVQHIVSPMSTCNSDSPDWPTDFEPDFADLFANDLFDFDNSGLSADTMMLDMPTAAEAALSECTYTTGLAPPAVIEPCAVVTTSAGVEKEANGSVSAADSVTLHDGAEMMATSAWYLLQTHISTSLAKLRCIDHPKNPLADLLLRQTPEHIAAIGVQAVQKAMVFGEGSLPALTALCFLHTIYAFSFITYGRKAVSRSDDLFGQAIAYARNFGQPDRDNYLQVASMIWQPSGMSLTTFNERTQSPCSMALRAHPTPDSPAIAAVKSFLDHYEASMLATQHEPTAHLSQEFVFLASTVLHTLLQEFPNEASLTHSFDKMQHWMATGALTSVRQLELELFGAGRAALGCSTAFYDIFVPRTRHLCDSLYAGLEPAEKQRSAYYEKSVLLILEMFGKMKTRVQQKLRPVDDQPPDVKHTASACMQLQSPPDSVEEDESLSGTTPHGNVATGDVATAEEPSTETPGSQKIEVESVSCCTICGYRPKGAPKWFRGSMHKHMKTKHSGEVIYKCPFPGCNSQYRNRLDNLQQHQKEKNHYIGDEAVAKKARRQDQTPENGSNDEGSEDGASTPRRPSKRKKLQE